MLVPRSSGGPPDSINEIRLVRTSASSCAGVRGSCAKMRRCEPRFHPGPLLSLSTKATLSGDNRPGRRSIWLGRASVRPGASWANGWGRKFFGARGSDVLMQTELVWLLGAVAKGDEAAFERLYAATRAKLYGVLLRILGRPALAEEVMQETYLKVWKMADQFDPAIASPITWMVAIARNRAIDIVRKRGDVSIEEEPDALEVASEAPPPLARREMNEELKRLLACLGKLDPEKQRIVLLAYYSGW